MFKPKPRLFAITQRNNYYYYQQYGTAAAGFAARVFRSAIWAGSACRIRVITFRTLGHVYTLKIQIK